MLHALQTVLVKERTPLFRWTMSMLLFLAAFLIRFALDDRFPPGFPYLTFFPAVILATAIGGPAPGMVNALLGGLTAWYFFIPPAYSFSMNAGTAVAMTFYTIVVTVDIVIIHVILVTSRQLRRTLGMLEESETQRQLVMAETSHRLKNTLAMVQAIARQTLRPAMQASDYDQYEARLKSLASAQDLLTAENWKQTDIESVLLATLRNLGVQDRVRLEGPGVAVSATKAAALSMIAHELATNALKHGALSNADGSVDIRWTVTADDRMFELVWTERNGPPVEPPSRKGFGSRLISMGLDGAGSQTVEFHPAGLVARFGAPLEALSK